MNIEKLAAFFDENGEPLQVDVYDHAVNEKLQYSKLYVEALHGFFRNYPVRDLMYDLYVGLSDKEGYVYDGQLVVIFKEIRHEELGDGCRKVNKVIEFNFQSGESITANSMQEFCVEGEEEEEEVDYEFNLVSCDDCDFDLEELDDPGSSPHIHDGEEPHEDEWVKDLCAFMGGNYDEQLEFYKTSEVYRSFVDRLINEYQQENQ